MAGDEAKLEPARAVNNLGETSEHPPRSCHGEEHPKGHVAPGKVDWGQLQVVVGRDDQI
jgi:hypothetical protein